MIGADSCGCGEERCPGGADDIVLIDAVAGDADRADNDEAAGLAQF